MFKIDPEIFDVLELKYGGPNGVIRRIGCPPRTYFDWRQRGFQREWKREMMERVLRTYIAGWKVKG